MKNSIKKVGSGRRAQANRFFLLLFNVRTLLVCRALFSTWSPIYVYGLTESYWLRSKMINKNEKKN